MKKDKGGRMNGQVPGGEILVYQTDNGKIRLDVRLERETLWMTKNDMAHLFQCSVDNISLHLKNIYSEGELTPSATTEEFSVVRLEGSRYVSHQPSRWGRSLNQVKSVPLRLA